MLQNNNPSAVLTGLNPNGCAERDGEIVSNPKGDRSDQTQRFRELALTHLDDVYTLARYLLRDAADAEDAVQECYLRAFRHFGSFRGSSIKPWLFAILRNVCHAEFARRTKFPLQTNDAEDSDAAIPLWREAQESPEIEVLRRLDTETIQRLLATLPESFREVIVLREIDDLSYREISDAVGIPLGTVMSRLARARLMLRTAWIAEEGHPK
jgi:RNA polymerase sigma-70 factor (ECF subfamily)